MDSIELGKRIREARLSKKMTQSEVVGTFITRNMLSQIESGTATPSFKTLEYLSGVLDIPVNQLIPEPEQNTVIHLTDDEQYLNGKQYLLKHNYSLAITTFENLLIEGNPLYDEISALLAKAYYEEAKALSGSKGSNPQVLISYLKKAVQLSSKGLFSNRELKTSSLILLDSLLEEQYNEKL